MENVRINKIDDKNFFPIPDSIVEELDEAVDYAVIKKEDGVICFIPTIDDIYDDEVYSDGELYQDDELPNSIDGGEIV